MDQFELEDRKSIQAIFTELNNNFPDVIEGALYPKRNEIVQSLISKYTLPGMAVFVGSILRLFTKTHVNNFL
jgi:hypothetical protein